MLLAIPVGSSHAVSPSFAERMDVGPYDVIVEIIPFPLFAPGNASVKAIALSKETGKVVMDVNVTIEVSGPSGETRAFPLRAQRTGQFTGLASVTERGQHQVTAVVISAADTHRGSGSLMVYPDLPFRLRPFNESQDLVAGRPERILIQTVDAWSGRSIGLFDDLTIRVERLSEGRSTTLEFVEVSAARTEAGGWSFEHVFQDAGPYSLRFASMSGELDFEDAPPVGLSISPAQVETRNTIPDASSAWFLAAAFLLAVASRRPGRF